MKHPIDSWPVQISVCIGILPEEKKIGAICSEINIHKYSKCRKLIQVTARLIQVFQNMAKNIFESPTAGMINLTELLWIIDAQELLLIGLERGDYRRLCPRKNRRCICC